MNSYMACMFSAEPRKQGPPTPCAGAAPVWPCITLASPEAAANWARGFTVMIPKLHSPSWTMWRFYGLKYVSAYACFYDTSMGHYTWYLVPFNELSLSSYTAYTSIIWIG
jgi:hypothetical protein